jgi:hypothetical protein
MASAITRSRLDLCSASCKALRFAPPAHPRGLRALTVPARSPSLGHCVMANEEWRLAGPTWIIDDHVERRYAAVIAGAFRHALRDWNIRRGAVANRRPQGRDQQIPHTAVLSRFAEHVSTSRTTRNRTRSALRGYRRGHQPKHRAIAGSVRTARPASERTASVRTSDSCEDRETQFRGSRCRRISPASAPLIPARWLQVSARRAPTFRTVQGSVDDAATRQGG